MRTIFLSYQKTEHLKVVSHCHSILADLPAVQLGPQIAGLAYRCILSLFEFVLLAQGTCFGTAGALSA